MKKLNGNFNKAIKEEEVEEVKQYDETNKRKKIFEIKIPKLILRNLSFKVNEQILKQEMSKYGNVANVLIPKRDDGRYKGYGFVNFSEMNEATKALNELNSNKKPFYGKKVAVDWCLPKDVFLNNSENQNNDKKRDFNKKKPEKPIKKLSDDEESASEDEELSEENEDEDEEESDEQEENEEDEEDENEDDDEEEESDEEEKKERDKKAKEKFKIKAKVGTKDVVEKRTIFIRNISFNASEENLKESFLKFGEIVYCKMVMDRDFERPKGTAFIQFVNAQSALDACAESNILEHDQRKLFIDLAISRTQASDLVSEKKEKEPQDNRNLALAKEGAVYANSYEADGVSKSDLEKRKKIEASNAAKLKLLHYFVSTTRLSVHNIPIKCNDQELKTTFLNALNENKLDEEVNKKNSRKILECRIMRDLTRVNSEGVAKSKGYGFVEFSKFEDALKALRATNNNPNLFSDKKTRLIVQFSIEDKRALQKKAKRLEKEHNNLDRNKKKKNAHLSLLKSKLTKKSKKKAFDATGGNNDDIEEDIAKKKEKNLIRTHMIENKITKRKLIEQNKKIKVENRAKRAKLSSEALEEDQRKAALSATERKKRRNKLKRDRAKNKVSKPQKVDNVDRLVDKYINEKSQKKRKWYE